MNIYIYIYICALYTCFMKRIKIIIITNVISHFVGLRPSFPFPSPVHVMMHMNKVIILLCDPR